MAKVLHSEEFQLVARLERLIAHKLIAVRLLMLCLHVFIWVKQSPLSFVCFGDFAPCSLCPVLWIRMRTVACWCDCGPMFGLKACILTYSCCLWSFENSWRRLVGNHLDQNCLPRSICLQLEFVWQGWSLDSITSSLNLRVIVYQPFLTMTWHLNMHQVFRASRMFDPLVSIDMRVWMGFLVLWIVKALELTSKTDSLEILVLGRSEWNL